MSVPALPDLCVGWRRCCPARSNWTFAMLPHGVLHTSHYRLHKKVGMFFLALMYPRLGRAKKRSIQHCELCRRRCGRVMSWGLTSFWRPGRHEACLYALMGSACRPKSPVEGVLGTNKMCLARIQPSWSAEYSQKCTVLPRGPVRAAKAMPMFLSASPFFCTDVSECRARTR